MVTKSGENLLYEDLTYQIRGACFSVWKEFGGVFKEKVVDRALTEELKSKGLRIEDQKVINICYKGKKIASYIPDKIINNSILLEIKCKPFLTKEDERQFWYYLKGSKYRVGLLINFGSKKLEIKRRIYDKARLKSIRVDPRSYPRLSASTQKGFSLIELLVVIGVIMLLTGVILIDYRSGQQGLTLQRATSKLAQDIRRVQEMAMSAQEFCPTSPCPPNPEIVPDGGYGVYFISSTTSYMLYADTSDSGGYDIGEEIKTIDLESGVNVDSATPNPVSINFKPPDPIVTITGGSGATIIISLESDPSITRTITVNEVGMIEID